MQVTAAGESTSGGRQRHQPRSSRGDTESTGATGRAGGRVSGAARTERPTRVSNTGAGRWCVRSQLQQLPFQGWKCNMSFHCCCQGILFVS